MDRLSKLALTLTPGVGSIRFRKLLERFDSLEDVVDADIRELTEIVPIKVAYSLKNPNLKKARREMERAESMGVHLIFFDEEAYPEELRNIQHAPPLLYAKGNVKLLQRRKFAIVGTRKPTDYGRRMAVNFASALKEAGLVIVSGGAIGIDSMAHKGALPDTIVVLGSGIDMLYPRSNLRLFKEILDKGGLLLSQFPMGTQPSKETFPMRNLTIAGLSIGVLMVEGSEDSGALITARYAFDFDREVFTIPNRVDVPQSRGPIRLMREHVAHVVASPEDILKELGLGVSSIREKSIPLSDMERRVLDAIVGKVHFDDLLEQFGDISSLSMALLNLELKGLIEKLPGNYYQRV